MSQAQLSRPERADIRVAIIEDERDTRECLSLLVNGTVRWTNANQTGLLGFGGDANDDHEAQFEGSVGWLLSRNIVVGAEYRTKPDNLSFAEEEDWFDIYAAWAVNKHFSVTAAWADLGSIATFEDQRSLYISLQAGF